MLHLMPGINIPLQRVKLVDKSDNGIYSNQQCNFVPQNIHHSRFIEHKNLGKGNIYSTAAKKINHSEHVYFQFQVMYS